MLTRGAGLWVDCYLLHLSVVIRCKSMMVIFMFGASVSGGSGVLHCSIVVWLRDSEDCNGVLHQLATSRQIAASTMIMIDRCRRLQLATKDV